MTSGAAGTFAAVARLTACPSCDSRFLQPMRCEPQADGSVLVDLRCPDCMTVLQLPYTREEMQAYERSVSESMEALAAVLGPALEQDLVGADDFARGGRGRSPRRAG